MIRRTSNKTIALFLATSIMVGYASPISKSVYAYSMTNLPNGFTEVAIGNDESSKKATYDETDKKFTIKGSGIEIGKDEGKTDNYQFISYEVKGDATIIARLVDFDMSLSPYGQAGIFIRNDNSTDNADYMGVYVEPSKNEYRYAFRDNTSGGTGAATISGLNAQSKNKFIKIEKVGTSCKYYIAEDEAFENIIAQGGQIIKAESDAWSVGFVASNGNSGNSSIAIFDEVTIKDSKGILYQSNPRVVEEPVIPEAPGGLEKPEVPELPETPVIRESFLPEGFFNSNIGNNDKNGYSNFDKDNKKFTIEGSGKVIGKDQGSTDDYQFLNYNVVGDATIIARLVDFDMSQAQYGQAGVFMRSNNTENNADYFGVYVEQSKNEYRYAYRDNNGNSGAAALSGLTSESKNKFIKIEKVGTSFKYYISEDELFENIIAQGGQTVTTNSDNWSVGFVVSNGGSENPAISTFDEVTIKDSKGNVYQSNPKENEVPEIPDEPAIREGFLPKGFNNNNIDNTDTTGYSNFDISDKKFTIEGSGKYIGKDTNSTDNYQFLSYRVVGDATITARLVDFDMSQAQYGQAGVFMRTDNVSNNADYFGVYVEPSKNEYRYAYRDNFEKRSGAASIAGLNNKSKNQYIKLVKSGTLFTAYISEDPTFPSDKTIVRTQGISTESTAWYVGFVASNGGSSNPSKATFDNVRIETSDKLYYDSTLEQRPVDTVENLKAIAGDKNVSLSWDSVDNATSYIIKRSTEKLGEYTEIATVEASNNTYVDTNVENFTTYYYKVVGVNEKGVSHDSQTAIVVPNNSNPLNMQYGKDSAVFTMTNEPNETVNYSNITISGYTDKNGTITFKQNGEIIAEETSKSANEVFTQNITLNYGRNTIDIYQKTEDGKTSLKSYNVVYLVDANYDKVVDSNYKGVNGELVNGISTYNNLTEAVNSVSKKNTERVTILVKNGVYKEKLTIESPYISLVGEDSKKTIITYDAANGTINPETGVKYGTSKSASVIIKSKAVGFTSENITIENSYKEQGNVEGDQAVALSNQADQSIFVNCRFIGNQDTLLADASSTSPARQYYYNSYIEGDVDFIFGRAQAVFNNCEIASYNRNSKIGVNNGFITAADTWDKDNYGYLIMNSRLTGLDDIRDDSVALGRPWRPSSQTEKMTPAVTYVNTYMGSHITTKGWDDMGENSLASTSRFNEFASYGPGAKLSNTRNTLSLAEAENYTMEKVFAKDSAKTTNGENAYSEDWNPESESNKVNINNLYNKDNVVIVPAISLTLDINEMELIIGETKTIKSIVGPEDATDKNVAFSSDNEFVAKVDELGSISGISAGTAKITAKIGNLSAECIVTVVPEIVNNAPVIEAEDVTINFGEAFDPKKYVAAYDEEDGIITDKIVVTKNTVSPFKAGVYKVIYEVQDSVGVKAIKEISVTVNESEKPVIFAEDVNIKVGDVFDPIANVTAYDKEDGDLTSVIKVKKNTVKTSKAGEYYVRYEVIDSHKNKVEKQISVIVRSNEKPVITADNITIDIGEKFDATQIAKASDKEDGDLTSDIEIIENTVDVSKEGSYKVTFSVTDSDENTVTKQITVDVVDMKESLTIDSMKSKTSKVTGKGIANSKVEVYINNELMGSSTVGSKGTYKVSISKQTPGTIIEVKMTTNGGSTITKTTTVIDEFKKFSIKTVKASANVITGSGVEGATVTAYVNNEVIGTSTIESNGEYSISIPNQEIGTIIVVEVSKNGYITKSKNVTVKK